MNFVEYIYVKYINMLNILNSMVVGACQSFQFFRQKNLISWK